MLVNDFKENCTQYDNFEIWDVENIDTFFSGNAVLNEIFKTDYKMTVEEMKEKRAEVEDSDMLIMQKLLDQIGDKHFFIFTLHDENHLELIQMQAMKIMDFGIDIEHVAHDHVFIVVMDKKKEPNIMHN